MRGQSIESLHNNGRHADAAAWQASAAVGVAVFVGAAAPVGPPPRARTSTFCVRRAAGVAGYGSQVTMTMALRRVKAAPATAMSYLSVVWGILAGLAIFNVRCYGCQLRSDWYAAA